MSAALETESTIEILRALHSKTALSFYDSSQFFKIRLSIFHPASECAFGQIQTFENHVILAGRIVKRSALFSSKCLVSGHNYFC